MKDIRLIPALLIALLWVLIPGAFIRGLSEYSFFFMNPFLGGIIQSALWMIGFVPFFFWLGNRRKKKENPSVTPPPAEDEIHDAKRPENSEMTTTSEDEYSAATDDNSTVQDANNGLSIEEAKKQLSKRYEIPTEDIDIILKG